MPTDHPPQAPGAINVVVQQRSSALGIGSTICGVISIFFLALLFSPLGLILGGIGIVKKQYVLSTIGILASLGGLATSPMFYMLIGISHIASM